MLTIAFAGSFAARMLEPVRAQLSLPCQLIVAANANDILSRLADVDVLVSLEFSARMAEAAPRLSLLQVPGAGRDRIDRAALRPGTRLANAYGHEAGIAEYIIGAMIALSRGFSRLDASCVGVSGRASGRSPMLHRRSGRSWRGPALALLAMATLDAPSPAARRPLPSRCVPCEEHRQSRQWTAFRWSAARNVSIACCFELTISPLRCRYRQERAT